MVLTEKTPLCDGTNAGFPIVETQIVGCYTERSFRFKTREWNDWDSWVCDSDRIIALSPGEIPWFGVVIWERTANTQITQDVPSTIRFQQQQLQ